MVQPTQVPPVEPTPTPVSLIAFGDGDDGPLVVPAGEVVTINTTRVNVTANGNTAAPANSDGFRVGDTVLFHQTQGTANVGRYELNVIARIDSPNGWVLEEPLTYNYDNTNGRAQVIKVPQYTDVTVESGGRLTAPEWDGSTGGFLVFLANGQINAQGFIDMVGRGFKGGYGNDARPYGWDRPFCQPVGSGIEGQQGNSPTGPGGCSRDPNGGGGGGGNEGSGDPAWGSGGGGGHATPGEGGFGPNPGAGGSDYGAPQLTWMHFGSGGGGGAWGTNPYGGGRNSIQGNAHSGQGGGAILIYGRTIAALRATVSGNPGGNSTGAQGGYAGGGGAGGSIKIIGEQVTTTEMHAYAGTGGEGLLGNGGNGGIGRIRIEYCNAFTPGAASPAASVEQVQCIQPTPTQTPTNTPTSTPTNTPTSTALPTMTPTSTPTEGPTPVPTPIPPILNVQSSASTMSLQWQPSNDPDVTSYRVLRTLSNTLELEPLITVDDTSYLDLPGTPVSNTLQTTITRGDGGCYQVEALRSDGSVATTSNRSCDTFGKVELWIPDIWAQSGETVLVPINIRNASGLRITANEIRLAYDTAVLSPTRVLASSVVQEAYQVASDVQTSDIVRIAAFSEEQPVLYGQGTLFWVEFQVIGDQGSESVLELRKVTGDVTGSDPGGSIIYASDDLNNPIPLSLESGRLRIGDAHSMGDVDGNGSMQAEDGTNALHIATGQHYATWQQSGAGDVNGDGRVGAADATMIFYHYMHGVWPQPGQVVTQTNQVADIASAVPGPILVGGSARGSCLTYVQIAVP